MDPGTALLLALTLAAVYVAGESTALHFSRTGRRALLAAVGGSLGYAVAGTLPRLDAWWLVVSAVIASSYIEDTVTRHTVLTRFTVPEAARLRGSPEAEGAAAALDAAAAAVSARRGISLSLYQAFGRASGALARERGKMVSLLAAAPRADLNYALSTCCLAAVLEAGGAAVAAILASPAAEGGRLDDLSVLSRAALVDAFQKVGLRHRPARQARAAAVVLATRGLELTRLKSLLDDGGDHHSFHRFVYSDLQNAARAAVASHVAAEGAAVAAAFAARAAATRAPLPRGVLLRVVSDIDDTLISSGGHYPAGCDSSLPRGCPYPGACAFLNELDAGHAAALAAALAPAAPPSAPATPTAAERAGTPTAADRADRAAAHRLASTLLTPWDDAFTDAARHRAVTIASAGGRAPPCARRGAAPTLHQRGGHLVFLSARPETYRGLSETNTLKSFFAPLVAAHRLHRWPVLLLGSLRSGPRALAAALTRARGPRPGAAGARAGLSTHLFTSLYKRKLERLLSFVSLYPEACWIFVGDSGQGDMLLAEELARRSLAPRSPLPHVASFIMRAGRVTDTLSSLRCTKANKAAWLAAWRGERIFVHKTYVGAAVDAATMGLISQEGLQRVALEACWDARAAAARYGPRAADWARLARRINADVAAANDVLPDDLRVPLLKLGGVGGEPRGASPPASPRGGSPPPPPPTARRGTPQPPPRPGRVRGGGNGGLLSPTAAGSSPPWSPLAQGGSPLGTSPAGGAAWPPAWTARRSASPSPAASRGATPPPPASRKDALATAPSLASGLG